MTRAPKVVVLLLVVAWSWFSFAPPAVAQDKKNDAKKKSERWAVLIGVDDYAYAKDLQFCGADMQALRGELVKVGFEDRQVLLLHDDAKEKRLQPYKSNIQKQIELTCSNAEWGDLVLIAFSGHGIHFDKVSYLCPTDAKLDDKETLVSLDWVYEKLQKCQADLKLVMVDACRNVPAELSEKKSFTSAERKDGTRAFVQELDRLPRGIVLLNSCAEGEFAQEDKEFGHGVFMNFLLEGLQGKADKDGDRTVTLSEWFRYASKETKLHVSQKFGESQNPRLKGNYDIELLDFEVASLSVPRRPEPVKPLPSETPKPNRQTGTLPANAAKTLTNSIDMKLALIPAGEFEMGDSIDGPVHRVRISKPFYLGVYEVTQSQYKQVVGTNPSWFSKTGVGKGKVSGLDTSDSPVEWVSWDDAQEFCKKLSALSGEQSMGREYRLPTEAEWEYACRAGTQTKFHFGDVLNGDKANVNGTEPEGTTTKGPYLGRTTSVGRYGANAFGLYDMHGNVWE